MNKIKHLLNRYIEVHCCRDIELGTLLKQYVNKIESERHRYYHTLGHVCSVFNRLGHNIHSLLFAICHDIVYNPRSKTNEEDSIEYIKKTGLNNLVTAEVFNVLCLHILDTKDISKVTNYNIADRHDVLGDLDQLIKYFELIKKEFQCYQHSDFIDAHCSIIMKIRDVHQANKSVSNEYMKHVRKPINNIGIYVGSFNPFHVGHYGVLLEAEKLFSKVVLAKGFNPEKVLEYNNSEILEWRDVPSALLCKETVIYTGTIFDLYDKYSKLYEKVTFIKGFRNHQDIEYDLNQYRVIRDINPNINFVFIPCQPGTEHISSSMIRNLKKLNLSTNMYEI